MKKYQLITYNAESGADEGPAYPTIRKALAGVREWLHNFPDDGAIVYDLEAKKICRIRGYFPEYARPVEGRK